MPFKQAEVDELLAATGRQCCLCQRMHGVQIHHIEPKEDGGEDVIENAIPLCPNCHDEVHGTYVSGRTTRTYSASELRLHRDRTIERVAKGVEAPQSSSDTKSRVTLHVLYKSLEAPAWDRRNIELRFSITNLTSEVLKITALVLRVEKKKRTSKIRLEIAGAPKSEYPLQADLTESSSVDLLCDTDVQFDIPSDDTQAFRVRCTARAGYVYTCVIDAMVLNLVTQESLSLSSDAITLEYPIGSIEEIG